MVDIYWKFQDDEDPLAINDLQICFSKTLKILIKTYEYETPCIGRRFRQYHQVHIR